MTDISFKNADGSARNTPRVVNAPDRIDPKTGEVTNPVEVVDVNELKRVEDEVLSAIKEIL